MRGPAVEIDRAVRQVLAELRVAPREAGAVAPVPQRAGASLVNTKVLTFDIAREQLDGQTELVVAAGTIVTPLAREFLNDRGVTVRSQSVDMPNDSHPIACGSCSSLKAPWLYSLLAPAGLAEAAIVSLARQGIELVPIASAGGVAAMLDSTADALAGGRASGVIVVSDDAALLACAANKRTGVRGVVAQCPQQVARAVRTVASNLLAVEPAGKSLHELRNIVRAFCASAKARRPPAQVKELLGGR